MYYVSCPERAEDLNWCQWLIIGHEDINQLQEDVIGEISDKLHENEEIQDLRDNDDDSWALKVRDHFRSLGYFCEPSSLNWGLGE